MVRKNTNIHGILLLAGIVIGAIFDSSSGGTMVVVALGLEFIDEMRR